eukprot:UC4_evm2s940
MKSGVPGNCIHLVRPHGAPGDIDPEVLKIVSAAIKTAGVAVVDGYHVTSCSSIEGSDDLLECVYFEDTSGDKLEVPCEAFISMDVKSPDSDTFMAVNDSCLVFDRRLVINAGFQTNDKCIYAAGPFTKYSRRVYATDMQPEIYNSKENGQKLAEAILPILDPILPLTEILTDDLPIFKSPKVVGAILPTNCEYLHICKPRALGSYEEHISEPDHGRELLTGAFNDNYSYFRCHVNRYGVIETITNLSMGDIPDRSNFINLYGLHEKYLNNLVARYDEGLIKDLYQFFRESWSVAVFHDRFLEFASETAEAVADDPAIDGHAFSKGVRKLVMDGEVFAENDSDEAKALAGLVDQPMVSKFIKDKLDRPENHVVFQGFNELRLFCNRNTSPVLPLSVKSDIKTRKLLGSSSSLKEFAVILRMSEPAGLLAEIRVRAASTFMPSVGGRTASACWKQEYAVSCFRDNLFSHILEPVSAAREMSNLHNFCTSKSIFMSNLFIGPVMISVSLLIAHGWTARAQPSPGGGGYLL